MMPANNALLLSVDSRVMNIPEQQLQGELLEGFEILKFLGMKQELWVWKPEKVLWSWNEKHGQN